MSTPAIAEGTPLVAAIVGDCEPDLRCLLRDVLVEHDTLLDGDMVVLPPDLVFAVVTRDDANAVLTAARVLASGRPIIALLPLADDALAELAFLYGAAATYAFDTPIDRLRAVLHALDPR